MTANKLIILFIMGLCLVMFSVLRDHGMNTTVESFQNSGCFLTWDGTKLIVATSEKQMENLPAELRPIFFHPIPINYADSDLLVTLPGIGPVTAKRILQMRSQQGKITGRAQLLSIKGIGEKTASTIEQYTTYEL